MIDLTPVVLFGGNCADAMMFYKSCIGGESATTQVGETPMQDQTPPEQHHKLVQRVESQLRRTLRRC